MRMSRIDTQKLSWPASGEIIASQRSPAWSEDIKSERMPVNGAGTKKQRCAICTYRWSPGPDCDCPLCGGVVTLAAVDVFSARPGRPSFFMHACIMRLHRDFRAEDPDYFRSLGLAYLSIGLPNDALFQFYLARRCGSADPHLDRAIRFLEYRPKAVPS